MSITIDIDDLINTSHEYGIGAACSLNCAKAYHQACDALADRADHFVDEPMRFIGWGPDWVVIIRRGE